MPHPSAVLAALVLVCACSRDGGQRREAPPVEPSASVTPDEPAREGESEDPRERAASERAPLELGWSSVPGPPTRTADAHNRRGLTLHRAGDYEQSLAAFDEALAVEPDYAWARYNRACALARLGQFEPAAAELERLLRADLPRFGPRLQTDDDLAELRGSAVGTALERAHEQIAAAYLAAVATGVTAVVYRDLDWNPHVRRGLTGYEHLRLGVLDPQQGRFIPLSPELPTALGAWLDRDSKRLLVVTGEIVSADMWVVQPKDIGVHVYDLARLGVPINEAKSIDRRRPQTNDIRTAVSVALEGDSVRLTYHDLGYAWMHDLSLTIEAGKSRLIAETWEVGADEEAERRMVAQRELHLSDEHAHLHIDGHGVQRHRPEAAGVRVQGREVRVDGLAEAFQLDAAHRRVSSARVERSEDGRFVLVVGHLAKCSASDERDVDISVVASRLDLEGGTVTRLAKTSRFGGAELGSDGTVYFDDGERAVRFPPESSEAIADLPPGVRFAIPGYYYDCSI
jgi:tetratricopeptide (TPR) repeat protein